MKTALAPSVETPSGSTSTQLHVPAPVSVVRGFVASEQRADVYNLTVDVVPEFFADGILVHNCDALRYLLTNLGNEARFHFPAPEPSVTTLAPNATGTQNAPAVPSIGGFPIMQGGAPWEL
ncbi:hypothetical protein [Streptomyces noursei]|uniref:hypothetical protein n=1 Tax=Streptomyces noursei TaxID=1971 RepID=UPI003556D80B